MPPLPKIALDHGLRFLPERDPHYAKVGLLLHFNGVDGQTTTTDEKGHAVGLAAGISLRAAAKKYGTTGCRYTTGGAVVTVAAAADLVLGTQPFTAEMFARINSAYLGNDAAKSLGNTQFPGGLNTWALLLFRVDGSTRQPLQFIAGNIGTLTLPFELDANDNIYRHWCVERVNNGAVSKLSVAMNGSIVSSLEFNSALALSNNATDVVISASPSTLGGGGYSADHDEIRMTFGVARYNGANFRVPPKEFPNS